MPLIKKIQPVIFTYLIFATSFAFAQREELPFTHVEPPNWYVGLKNSVVQVLFHSDKVNLADYKTVSLKYKGVTLKEVRTVENPHYLFLTLDISPSAKKGAIPITFASGKNTITYDYPIHPRSSEKNRIQGFNSADVLYLIMPDRFANGDPKNDVVAGMLEGNDRSKPEARHGGDLKGITDHLDYIKDLGVTAIWLNPVLENDQKKSSYHGYAITDLYQVDARFGGNSAYLDFIDQSHRRGLKVIQDMVMNHIGNDHWLMHDMPEKTWINQWPEFTRSNYQSNVISDPYQSAYDAGRMNDGWFDTTMPDVNQQNPLFATYLIQNTLWWIEFAGIDGIRMDTHPYPDKNFMSRWAKTVLDEYPAFNIVGEAWINSIPATAYWQKGMMNKDGYQSNLPTVTDFPFCFTVPQALNEPGGWDTGMRKLYTLLSQDFLYPDPNHNLTFLDNHDMSRFFLSVGKDIRKFKMGLAFLLTTRGIPQLYYGTELLMDGDGGYHPNVRLDFPGGWPGDDANGFNKEGRTELQNEAFDYLKALLNWRKREPVIHKGKLTHYIPEENTYVYFRSNDLKTIMVVLNGATTDKALVTETFADDLKEKTSAVNVITGEVVGNLKQISIPAQSALILELQ
jgi:neopullulanase